MCKKFDKVIEKFWLVQVRCSIVVDVLKSVRLIGCCLQRDSGSMNSLMSGDTIACHLGDIGSKQIFTKTGSYKVTSMLLEISACILQYRGRLRFWYRWQNWHKTVLAWFQFQWETLQRVSVLAESHESFLC